jgi:tape measure domain-containing protein
MSDVNAGTVTAYLRLRMDQFTSGLRDANRQMDESSRRFESNYGRVAQAAQRAGAVMVGFGAAGLAAAGGMVKLAMEQEQASVAFTNLMKSGAGAQKMLRELRDFANRTPFEFPQVRDAARQLMAFGFQAQKIVPMLTDIGDAAAAMGGSAEMIDRITRALGQMGAKGKVSAEEMLQLTEAGIPAWQLLAEQMGKTTAEVMKLSEKGLLPAGQAIDDLLAGMRGRFGGQMANQAETAAGKLSTLKDELRDTATQMGMALLPAAEDTIDALGGIAKAINGLPDPAKGALGKLVVGGSFTVAVIGGLGLMAGSVGALRNEIVLLNAALVGTKAGALLGGGLTTAGVALAAGGAYYGMNRNMQRDFGMSIPESVGVTWRGIVTGKQQESQKADAGRERGVAAGGFPGMPQDQLPPVWVNGMVLGPRGWRVAGVGSSGAVHKGTHGEPGTFDIGGKQISGVAASSGRTWEELAQELSALGLVVAYRKKGDRGITNDHFHVADPRLSPEETRRLLAQRASGNSRIFTPQGMDVASVAQSATGKLPPVSASVAAANQAALASAQGQAVRAAQASVREANALLAEAKSAGKKPNEADQEYRDRIATLRNGVAVAEANLAKARKDAAEEAKRNTEQAREKAKRAREKRQAEEERIAGLESQVRAQREANATAEAALTQTLADDLAVATRLRVRRAEDLAAAKAAPDSGTREGLLRTEVAQGAYTAARANERGLREQIQGQRKDAAEEAGKRYDAALVDRARSLVEDVRQGRVGSGEAAYVLRVWAGQATFPDASKQILDLVTDAVKAGEALAAEKAKALAENRALVRGAAPYSNLPGVVVPPQGGRYDLSDWRTRGTVPDWRDSGRLDSRIPRRAPLSDMPTEFPLFQPVDVQALLAWQKRKEETKPEATAPARPTFRDQFSRYTGIASLLQGVGLLPRGGAVGGAMTGAQQGLSLAGFIPGASLATGAAVGAVVGLLKGIFGDSGEAERRRKEALDIQRQQLRKLSDINNTLRPVSDYFRGLGLNLLPQAQAFAPAAATSYVAQTGRGA